MQNKMLDAIPIARIVKELRLSDINVSRTRFSVLSNLQRRSLSHTRRHFVEQRPPSSNKTPPPNQPPPLSDYVPKASELASYAAKVGSGRSFLRSTTEPYLAYGATEKLWAECARQADYQVPNVLKKPAEPAPKNDAGEDIGTGSGLWFAPRGQGGIALPVTFMTWAQVMFLHIYILNARLRRLPAEHVRVWQQHLLDFFFHAAETKMEKWHGMAARGIRNKNLKDLWLSWRGVILSYDEGLIKDDAVLAAAVWRSVFRGSVDADVTDIAQVTAYLRRELQKLDVASSQDITMGEVKFGQLTDVGKDIMAYSASMAESFNAADAVQAVK